MCSQKSHKNVLGKFGEIQAKILRIPKTLPAQTPIRRITAGVSISPNNVAITFFNAVH